MMMRAGRKRERAFTLVEAMLAAIVLSLVVASLSMPFVAGAQNDLNNARLALAATLGQELMEEILAKPFGDPDDGNIVPGPDGLEISGRQYFDNTDDYDGYIEAAGQIRPFGVAVNDEQLLATISRSATVEYVHVAGQQQDEPPTFCRVTVRVYHGQQPLLTLTRLVYSNEGISSDDSEADAQDA